MKISKHGYGKVKKLIAAAEKDYMDSVKMVAHYGADQDGWHGEAYAMHYAEQLRAQDILMRLKNVESKMEIVDPLPNLSVSIGKPVVIEVSEGKKEFLIDGYRYENNPVILTPESPIGKALMGKKAGDSFEYVIGPKHYAGRIVSVKI